MKNIKIVVYFIGNSLKGSNATNKLECQEQTQDKDGVQGQDALP